MTGLKKRIVQFLISEEGPTTTEYAVVLAVLMIAAIGAVTLLGEKLHSAFRTADAGTPDR